MTTTKTNLTVNFQDMFAEKQKDGYDANSENTLPFPLMGVFAKK